MLQILKAISLIFRGVRLHQDLKEQKQEKQHRENVRGVKTKMINDILTGNAPSDITALYVSSLKHIATHYKTDFIVDLQEVYSALSVNETGKIITAVAHRSIDNDCYFIQTYYQYTDREFGPLAGNIHWVIKRNIHLNRYEFCTEMMMNTQDRNNKTDFGIRLRQLLISYEEISRRSQTP
jgi:hypothetical protein